VYSEARYNNFDVLVPEGRRQKAEGRRQKAEGRRQKAEGRRQKAEGKKVCTVSFLTFFNWMVISAALP
jgi:hypothetical protein